MKEPLWMLLAAMASSGPLAVRGAEDNPGADIVYSARYYKPGKEVSRYHLWRIAADGSGRFQVTSHSKAADHSPVWLADGRTILFVREEGGTNRLCTVKEGGGAVTTFDTGLGTQSSVSGLSPDRRSLLVRAEGEASQLYLLDVASKSRRALGPGWGAVFSPDGRKLYCPEFGKGQRSEILDLATGKRLPVRDGLRAGTWLEDGLLVAELFAEPSDGQPKLYLLRADGTLAREFTLPFNWGDENSPFADDLFRIPGDSDSVLYGRHAGGSSQGQVHEFWRIHLKTGKAALLAQGRDVAWAPDHHSFCTGDGRELADFSGNRSVWVSPLHIISLKDGSRHTIVSGLVSVGGFRLAPADSGKPGIAEGMSRRAGPAAGV